MKVGDPHSLQHSMIASRPFLVLVKIVSLLSSHRRVYRCSLHATYYTTYVTLENSDFGKKSLYSYKSFCAPSYCALFALPISGLNVFTVWLPRVFTTNMTPTCQTQVPSHQRQSGYSAAILYDTIFYKAVIKVISYIYIFSFAYHFNKKKISVM